MMQDGLHIGLAAWINEQRSSGSFPAYPAMPVVTSLVDLGAISNIHDLAKAAEFARLVNFIPRLGQFADLFNASEILWQVHRDILNRMDFAAEPWTSAERAEYQAARDILYTSDSLGQLVPSAKLLFYEERKRAYRDLCDSDGDPADIAQAMTDWMVLGYKQLIENALESIVRLSRRSSLYQAQEEAASLEPVRLLSYADINFAPTYFAPISAIARETWMEARVSFAELDRAVGNGQPSSKWKAYLANRSGEVLFDYAVINCIRPWYSPLLYQADDWKFHSNSITVSTGNGIHGLLPAYVDAVYLVSVKNITIAQRPKPNPQPVKPGVQQPVPTFPVVAGALGQIRFPPSDVLAKSLGNTGLNMGVVATGVNKSMTAHMVSASSNSLAVENPGSQQKISIFSKQSVALNLENKKIKLAPIDLNFRYTVLQAYLQKIPLQIPPSTGEEIAYEIYVAGFGCMKTPAAPNPNPHYQW